MKNRLTFTLILSLLTTFLLAQQFGQVSGKVIDVKNSETLVGVSVLVKGSSQLGAVTDIDGNFIINNVPTGNMTLTVSYVGYSTKEISDILIKEKETTTVDFTLSESTAVMAEVVITATRKQEAASTILLIQKNNITVSDGLSGDAIRRSPARSASDAIRRISGISIQDNRFPIVRGLSDRYNAVLVNGTPMPSTEPDRKAFSFDLFPSNLIDNILVNKAATPDMPADFAGGLIQLNTKDIPNENFINFQIGMGANTATQGKDFYQSSSKGKMDWLGLNDGSRDLPAAYPSVSASQNASKPQNVENSRLFSNDWGIEKVMAMPNLSLQLSGGFNKKMANGGVIGAIGALTYNRSVRNSQNFRAFYLNRDTLTRVNDNRYTTNYLNGALLNFTYQINPNNRLSFKNTLSVNTDNATTVREGITYDNAVVNSKSSLTRYKSNQLFSSQLAGEHRFVGGEGNGIKFNWILGTNLIKRDLPNQRQLSYILQDAGSEKAYLASIPNVPNVNSVGKLYSNLDEKMYIANADVTVPFKLANKTQNIKVGINYQNRARDFGARAFGMVGGRGTGVLLGLPQDQIFAPENIASDKFYYGELTDESYSYKAKTATIAPFIMLDNKITNKLRAAWGVRYESYPVNITSSQNVDSKFNSLLPSLNLTYSLTEKSNLRFSSSRTLARPELREMSPFAFYDFEINRSRSGDINLKQTDITNVDLRYEVFPEGGQMFSVSAFYKNFKNPIEEFYNTTGVGSYAIYYVNAKTANNYGAELEFRKHLGFLGNHKIWEDFVAFSNIAYIISDVTFGTNADGAKENRALQGQSPYIANVGLQYTNAENGWGATMLFNQIGRRIIEVGNQFNPNIYEAPRSLLDFQVSKRLKNAEIRFSVNDILNSRYNFYQDMNKNGKYDAANDNLMIRQVSGTNLNVTFSYKIQ